MTMTRKDYGSGGKTPPENNPTMREIANMNAPHSKQATGHTHGNNVIEINSENMDALAVGTRVLQGNREGYVKTVNKSGDPEELDDAVIAFKKEGEANTLDVPMTKVEILASGNLTFVKAY